MKFFTSEGLSMVQGEQQEAQECYNQSLQTTEQKVKKPAVEEQRYVIFGPIAYLNSRKDDEKKKVGHVEDLEKISIDELELSKVLKMGKNLQLELWEKLIKFLINYLHDFAWNHNDMKGINPNVMCQMLNIDPNFKLV